MKTITISKIFAVAVLALSLITFQSCEKDTPPKEEMITQSFGLEILTKKTPILTKGFDNNTWTVIYSTEPATLTLTGTGASTGRNYTRANTTIQELQSGAVSMVVLPGTYRATFMTPHKLVNNSWVLNNRHLNEVRSPVSDVMDLKIDEELTITGTPITLNASLNDFLVIWDIPTDDQTFVYNQSWFVGGTTGDAIRLLNTRYVADRFQYGYIDELTNFKGSPSNKVVMGTGWLKGNCYHVITSINSTTQILIPELVYNQIVI